VAVHLGSRVKLQASVSTTATAAAGCVPMVNARREVEDLVAVVVALAVVAEALAAEVAVVRHMGFANRAIILVQVVPAAALDQVVLLVVADRQGVLAAVLVASAVLVVPAAALAVPAARSVVVALARGLIVLMTLAIPALATIA